MENVKVEICPYCRCPFKKLKSHELYCKSVDARKVKEDQLKKEATEKTLNWWREKLDKFRFELATQFAVMKSATTSQDAYNFLVYIVRGLCEAGKSDSFYQYVLCHFINNQRCSLVYVEDKCDVQLVQKYIDDMLDTTRTQIYLSLTRDMDQVNKDQLLYVYRNPTMLLQ